MGRIVGESDRPNQRTKIVRLHFHRPIIGVLVLLAHSAPVSAAGGAYAVDDAVIGAVGDCQVETWVSSADNGNRILVSQPACVANFGIPVEITVSPQAVRTDGDWAAIGGLQAKSVLIPIEHHQVGVALSVGTLVDFSSGQGVQTYVNVPVSVHLGAQLRINLNGGWSLDELTDVHHATWGGGFEWDFATALSLIGEVYGQVGNDGDHDPRAQVGVRYSPSDTIDCDVIYGDNVTGERAQWLIAGLALRF